MERLGIKKTGRKGWSWRLKAVGMFCFVCLFFFLPYVISVPIWFAFIFDGARHSPLSPSRPFHPVPPFSFFLKTCLHLRTSVSLVQWQRGRGTLDQRLFHTFHFCFSKALQRFYICDTDYVGLRSQTLVWIHYQRDNYHNGGRGLISVSNWTWLGSCRPGPVAQRNPTLDKKKKKCNHIKTF